MIEITDLVNSRDLVELHESEMENIRGGNCEYGGSYGPGSVVTMDNGLTYECVDYPWYTGGDQWEFLY